MFDPENKPHNSRAPEPKSLEQIVLETLGAVDELKERRQFAEAAALADSVLDRVRAERPRSDSCLPLMLQCSAMVAANLKDYSKADRQLGEAIQLVAAHERDDLARSAIMTSLCMLKAEVCRSSGRVWEAVSLLETCADQTDQLPRPLQASLKLNLSGLYMDVEQSNRSDSLLHEVFDDFADDKDSRFAAEFGMVFHSAARREIHEFRFARGALLVSHARTFLDNAPEDMREESVTCILLEADCREKLGEFEEALALRQRCLIDVSRRYGEGHGRTIEVRRAYAFGHLEHGRFELAEALLRDNIRLARENGEAEHIMSSVMDLAMVYREQGLYRQAEEGLFALVSEFEEHPNHRLRVPLCGEYAQLVAHRGDMTGARAYLEKAIDDLRGKNDPHALSATAALLAIMAKILLSEDPVQARTAFDECCSLLEDLPPDTDIIPRSELELLATFIRTEDYDSETGSGVEEKILSDFKRKTGESNAYTTAGLMFCVASRLGAAGDTEGQLKMLEDARELLENRNRTGITLYGAILVKIAALLPYDDERRDKYLEMAQRLNRFE